MSAQVLTSGEWVIAAQILTSGGDIGRVSTVYARTDIGSSWFQHRMMLKVASGLSCYASAALSVADIACVAQGLRRAAA